MSDIIDSRDLLDELKTLDEEDSYDKERIEMIDDLKEEVGKDTGEDVIKGVLARTPVLGGLLEAVNLGHIYAASNRISEGKATDVDYSMVGR